MRLATTFKSIKLTLGLVSEAQIFCTCISQQGQYINRELLQALHWEVRFFTNDIIVFVCWMHVFGKTLCYGLAHAIYKESTFQIWSHSDEHRPSFTQECRLDPRVQLA